MGYPLKEEGFKAIPMPATLRKEIRQRAAESNEPLWIPARKWAMQIIEDEWEPDYDHRTKYIVTKLSEEEMLALEKLAFKCNMSLSGYVKAYYEYQKRKNDRV